MQAAPGAPAAASPGAANAIHQLIQMLATVFAPRAITERKAAINDPVEKASE
jgi:hypothetical protein